MRILALAAEIHPVDVAFAVAVIAGVGLICLGLALVAVRIIRPYRRVKATPAEPAPRFLEELGEIVLEVNKANGWKVLSPPDWDDPYRIPTCIALLHSEVSEALEGFRNGDQANFREELADVQIRLLDLSCGLGIDLDREVMAKLERNRARGFRHGGKKV